MESLWSLAVGVALGAFFLASILHQFRLRWWPRVARLDRLNLLPRWTFFAPNPGRHDVHVVYRDWAADGCGPWHQIANLGTGGFARWLWNPSRYPRKGMSDLANALLQFQAVQGGTDNPRMALLSDAYVGLLHWVMAQEPSPRAGHRQFALVLSHGFGDTRRLEVRYVSEVHRAAT